MPLQVRIGENYPPGDENKIIVRMGDAFERMHRFMMSRRLMVFDFETSGTRWFNTSVSCGMALAAWDDQGRIWNWYVPYRHQTTEKQLSFSRIRDALGSILANPYSLKIAHNMKFDDHFARVDGWEIGGPCYDTMVMSHLYDENNKLELESRIERHVRGKIECSCGGDHTQVRHWDHMVQRELKRLAKDRRLTKTEYLDEYGYSQVPINLCGTYACHDTQYTCELYEFYEVKQSVSSMFPADLVSTEMRLPEVLCDMEETGLAVDVEYVEDLKFALGGAKASLGEQISEVWGSSFNPGSDDQLRELLFGRMRLAPLNRTRKDQASVDGDTLKKYAELYPDIGLLSQWREADKLETTYTNSILARTDARNVCHSDFKQNGTNTGRLSCTKPNFQNFPSDSDARALAFSGKKIEDGGEDPWSVKRAFVVPDYGWKSVRLFFDYSQVELRVLAFYSQDPIMRDVFMRGGDIHHQTQVEVGEMMGTDPIPRRIAKVINFGLSYCLTSGGLARQAGIPEGDAVEFLNAFFLRYSRISAFRESFWEGIQADQNSSFMNLFGRRRRLPEIMSYKDWERRRAERQAIGSLVQGTAAELTKKSLVRISDFLRAEGLPARMVNTVHDEIQIDCPVDCLTRVVKGVKELMEDFPQFSPIPIVVDGAYTTSSWADKVDLPV